MKFYSYPSFIEHISASSSNHLAPMFLLYHSATDERDYIVDRIKGFFLNHSIKTFHMRQDEGKSALNELLSYDLFAKESLLIVHDIDKWEGSALDTFAKTLGEMAAPHPIKVILTASDDKSSTSFYNDHEGYCACLDLLREKPWDKDKRLLAWVVEVGSSYNKRIGASVGARLIERGKGQFAFTMSEVKALCQNVGSRAEVTLEDLQQLGSGLPAELSWDFAKKLVYEEAIGASLVFSKGVVDASFITQIRYFLHIGLALCSETSSEYTSSVRSAITKFSDQKKRSFTAMATRRGFSFFQKGLELLSETERLIRSGGREKEMLETLCIQLEREKRRGR